MRKRERRARGTGLWIWPILGSSSSLQLSRWFASSRRECWLLLQQIPTMQWEQRTCEHGLARLLMTGGTDGAVGMNEIQSSAGHQVVAAAGIVDEGLEFLQMEARRKQQKQESVAGQLERGEMPTDAVVVVGDAGEKQRRRQSPRWADRRGISTRRQVPLQPRLLCCRAALQRRVGGRVDRKRGR